MGTLMQVKRFHRVKSPRRLELRNNWPMASVPLAFLYNGALFKGLRRNEYVDFFP